MNGNPSNIDDTVRKLAGWLREASHVIAFTGAGVSTESGIPDFRSPGGVWSKTEPVYYEDFLKSAESRHEYWRQKSETHDGFLQGVPNVTHRALARWEQVGILQGLITQNIDGLHKVAGSENVLEIHGTAREIGCLDCEARFEADPLVQEFRRTDVPPDCPRCGGFLKHATISFGQALVPQVLEDSARWVGKSDLFLALGSSLVVHPAAGLPAIAKQSGGRLVIINRDETPLDATADLVLKTPLGKTFEAIEQALGEGD
jgi:NAD-dependent deacetylase